MKYNKQMKIYFAATNLRSSVRVIVDAGCQFCLFCLQFIYLFYLNSGSTVWKQKIFKSTGLKYK